MSIIYFSHSYRKEDNFLVEYFGQLIQSQGLILSLDPPSRSVNAAKLERHFNDSNGMVAVLTSREEGVSQYILFEILLCLRARKPLLVFIEDNLENKIIPSRILQSRFSRKSFIRQITEHQHAIHSLKTYMGTVPIPKYQPSIKKKACLLIGSSFLEEDKQRVIKGVIDNHGYYLVEFNESTGSVFPNQDIYEAFCSANLAICLVDSEFHMSHYMMGAIQTAMIPTILLTANSSYKYEPRIPGEYQPRLINTEDLIELRKTIDNEISLFEEDIIDIEDDNELKTYFEILLKVSSFKGNYDGVNHIFVNKFNNYEISGQGNIVGPNAHVHDISFNQIWNETKDGIDLNKLAEDLRTLRLKLKEEAKTLENDLSIGNIAGAESSAKKGDGPKAFEYMQKAGKWALDVACEISVPIATEVLKKLLGF